MLRKHKDAVGMTNEAFSESSGAAAYEGSPSLRCSTSLCGQDRTPECHRQQTPFPAPQAGFLQSWGLFCCKKMQYLETAIFSSQGWTELCARLVGSGSACPRVHVSKPSHALLSLSSDTKLLAPVATNQAQQEPDDSLPAFIPFPPSCATGSRSGEQSSKRARGAPAAPFSLITGDLDVLGRLFLFR